MKKAISLINSDLAEKPIKNVSFAKPFLKITYFPKFGIEVLFYIFYYMPRDSLQIIAAEEL